MALANVKINAISCERDGKHGEGVTRGYKKKNIVCRENWGVHPEEDVGRDDFDHEGVTLVVDVGSRKPRARRLSCEVLAKISETYGSFLERN